MGPMALKEERAVFSKIKTEELALVLGPEQSQRLPGRRGLWSTYVVQLRRTPANWSRPCIGDAQGRSLDPATVSAASAAGLTQTHLNIVRLIAFCLLA